MTRIRRTLFLGFLDQAVISLGSFLILVCAAQGLISAQFGYFALAVATVGLALSIVRAISGEALVAGARREAASLYAAPILGLVVVLSVCGSLMCVLMAASWASSSAAYLGAAIVIPGALFQDGVRYVLIYGRESRRLVTFDVVTVAVQCSAVLFASITARSAFACLLAWAIVVSASSALAVARFRIRVSLRAGLAWLKTVWKQSSAYATEAIVGAIVGYTTIVVIALFTSAGAVGAFRTTVAVFGLTSVVVNFVRSTYMRELAGRAQLNGRQVRRTYLLMSLLMFGVIGAVSVLLNCLPSAIGTAFFGDAWSLVAGLIVFGAINRFSSALSVIPTVLLRVAGVTWKATRARIVIAVISLGLGPVGALLAGAGGALLAESISYLLVFLVLSRILGSHLRRASVEQRPAVATKPS